MKRINEHLKDSSKKSRKDRATERGELLEYFAKQLNVSRARDGYPPLTIPRMARVLMATPTKDLYYLKRICEDAKDFSKKFWWEVNPKHHQEDGAKAKKKDL